MSPGNAFTYIMYSIGNLHKAFQVLRAIRRDGSPFYPEEFAITSAAEVLPTFVLEAHSSQYRIEAHLRPAGYVREVGQAGSFKIAAINAFKTVEGSGGAREMGITTLSLGKYVALAPRSRLTKLILWDVGILTGRSKQSTSRP
jgi:hypothetical protein